jgi:hypothetical protein
MPLQMLPSSLASSSVAALSHIPFPHHRPLPPCHPLAATPPHLAAAAQYPEFPPFLTFLVKVCVVCLYFTFALRRRSDYKHSS